MTQTLDIEPHGTIESLVDRIYRNRFPREMLKRRTAVWRVLCQSWFSRYIPENARVLEVAAGYCEFINNIKADERVAVDLNPETRLHAAPDVVVHEIAAERLGEIIPAAHFDVAFMSNFLEHCRTREQVLSVLRSVATSLKPGGRLLILGPNFRHCPGDYYDYFDHHLASPRNRSPRHSHSRGSLSRWSCPALYRSPSTAACQAGPGWCLSTFRFPGSGVFSVRNSSWSDGPRPVEDANPALDA